MQRWLITFPSIYHAFRAEKLLEKNEITVKMVAVPLSLSGSCDGLAAEVDFAQLQAAVQLLADNQVIMLQKGIKIND
jgi:hypothetical protein